MRLIIILGLIYLAYRLGKSKLVQSGLLRNPADPGSVQGIDNVMVKDPFCGAYFPKKDAVRLSFKGKDLHFCSETCRDEFKEAGKSADS